MEWNIITSNPCQRCKVPKNNSYVTTKKEKCFDELQTILFLESIVNEDIKYQAIANVTIYSGLRKGELLGLTWNDIDFEKCTLNIDKANSYLPEKGSFTKKPKNEESERVITIPKDVISLLKTYKLWQKQQRLKCGDLWHETNLLFTQWNGKPMGYDTPYTWFKRFVKKHNTAILDDNSIPDEEKNKYILPDISFHDLRHTHASLLIAENVDIKTISSRLGHAQPTTTMNIYAHKLKSSDIKASSAIDNLLNKNKQNKPSKDAEII